MKRKLGILSGILLLTSVVFLGVQSAYAGKEENWEITGREITGRNESTEMAAVSGEEITAVFVCEPTPAGQKQKAEQSDKKDNDVWEVRSFPVEEKNLSSESKEAAAAFEEGKLNTIVCEPTPAGQKQKAEQNDKKDNDVWEVRSFLTEEKNLLSSMEYQIQSREDISGSQFQTEATYVEGLLSYVHELNVDGEVVAWVEENCTVWFYTDGKVHLYLRTLTLHIEDSDFSPSYITYGKAINTDGSFSYTSGDMVTFSNGRRSQTYGLEFYVTPTTYRFWLSEK